MDIREFRGASGTALGPVKNGQLRLNFLALRQEFSEFWKAKKPDFFLFQRPREESTASTILPTFRRIRDFLKKDNKIPSIPRFSYDETIFSKTHWVILMMTQMILMMI